MTYPGIALDDVFNERVRQEGLWGQQNHADGTGPDVEPMPAVLTSTARELAEAARWRCQQAAAAGVVTWRHIAFEEFAEALAEDDPVKLRRELVQVAAVVVAWIEAIDRRRINSD